MRPGGLIVLDNTLWGGAVLDLETEDEDTRALQELNAKLAGDERGSMCLLPVADGVTLVRRVAAAEDLAQACVRALRERGWRGDQELAEDLEARLGVAPARLLRPLPVDLDELSGVLEGDPVHGGGRIDLRTGEVWPQFLLEKAESSRRRAWSTPTDRCG